MNRAISLMFMAAACGICCGCGGSDLPLVPVRGQVTFNGGPAPTSGNMVFNQVPGSGVEGLPRRPGRANFGIDGQFTATTFREGDGLLPGRYRVVMICMDGEAGPGRPFEQVSFVPPGWEPSELNIKPGSAPVTANIDVPPKK